MCLYIHTHTSPRQRGQRVWGYPDVVVALGGFALADVLDRVPESALIVRREPRIHRQLRCPEKRREGESANLV